MQRSTYNMYFKTPIDRQLYEYGWPHGSKKLDEANGNVSKIIDKNIKDPELKKQLQAHFKCASWYQFYFYCPSNVDLTGLDALNDILFRIRFEGKDGAVIEEKHVEVLSKMKIIDICFYSFDIKAQDLERVFDSVEYKDDITSIRFDDCIFKDTDHSVKETFSFENEITKKFFSEFKNLYSLVFANLIGVSKDEMGSYPENSFKNLNRDKYNSHLIRQRKKEAEERESKKIFVNPESAPYAEAPAKAKESLEKMEPSTNKEVIVSIDNVESLKSKDLKEITQIKFQGDSNTFPEISSLVSLALSKLPNLKCLTFEFVKIRYKTLMDLISEIKSKNIEIITFENCEYDEFSFLPTFELKDLFSLNNEVMQKIFKAFPTLDSVRFSSGLEDGQSAIVYAPSKHVKISKSEGTRVEIKRVVKQSKEETIPQAKKAEQESYSPADAMSLIDEIFSLTRKVTAESLISDMDEFVVRIININSTNVSDELEHEYYGLIDEYRKLAKNEDEVISFIQMPLKKQYLDRLSDKGKSLYFKYYEDQGVTLDFSFIGEGKERYIFCAEPSLGALVLLGLKKYYKESGSSEKLNKLINEANFSLIMNDFPLHISNTSPKEIFVHYFIQWYFKLRKTKDEKTQASEILSYLDRFSDYISTTNYYYAEKVDEKLEAHSIAYTKEAAINVKRDTLKEIPEVMLIRDLAKTDKVSNKTLGIFRELKKQDQERGQSILSDSEWRNVGIQMSQMLKEKDKTKERVKEFWEGWDE